MFLLDCCPCLQEYGNVSYKFATPTDHADRMLRDGDSADASIEMSGHGDRASSVTVIARDLKPVCAVVSIECPD